MDLSDLHPPFLSRSVASGRLIAILAFLLIGSLACQPEPELPTYWSAPAFELIDQTGTAFGNEDIAGRVVLADFIYTNCADICPALTATLRAVQDRLEADGLSPGRVLLLSFTVDPERDTPDVLSEYARRIDARSDGWKFLTGDRVVLERTLLEGFKLPFRGPTPAGPLRPGFEITHTNRMIFIDRSGVIRGIPNGQDATTEQLLRDIKRLAR
jgi:protein SCO1